MASRRDPAGFLVRREPADLVAGSFVWIGSSGSRTDALSASLPYRNQEFL